MWVLIIIIAIVLLIIIKFSYDTAKQRIQIGRQGGMANKYKTLISLLMSGHPNTEIFQETSDSLTLGVSGLGGVTTFLLLQTFGKVTIRWKMDSPLFGKHNFEWNFPEFMDQDKMVDRINNDLREYHRNVLGTNPFFNDML